MRDWGNRPEDPIDPKKKKDKKVLSLQSVTAGRCTYVVCLQSLSYRYDHTQLSRFHVRFG